MEWLARVYAETSDPRSQYPRLARVDVMASIAIHVCLYIGFVLALQKVTRLSIVSDKNLPALALALVLVMSLGYVGRLCRAKAIYHYKRSTMLSEDQALRETRQQMDQGYVTWYFLG